MRAASLLTRTSSWLGEALPIGVDFDLDRVHCVQLDSTRGGLRLRDACSFAYETDRETFLGDPDALRTWVGETIRKRRFTGRRIVTQVPQDALRLMVLNYSVNGLTANSQDGEAEQIVGLARERMKSDLSDFVIDYVRIRTSGDRQGDRSALVAVAPEAPVIDHLERLRHAGLRVERLEIGPTAIRRLIASRVSIGEGRAVLNLVIRLDQERTEFTLLSGKRLLLYREVEIGTRDLLRAAAQGLDCDEATARDLIASFGVGKDAFDAVPSEARDGADPFADAEEAIVEPLRELLRPSLRDLVEQAHKALSYAAFQTRGSSIERVHMIEMALRCPGLDAFLSELLQLPVETLRPMKQLAGAEHWVTRGADSRWAIALGFAMPSVDRMVRTAEARHA